MWLPRASSFPFPFSEEKCSRHSCALQGSVQRKSGITPARNSDISKFRHCKIRGFYLLNAEPSCPALTEVAHTSLPSAKTAQYDMQCHFQQWARALLEPSTLQVGAVPALQPLHTDNTLLPSRKSLCKHSLGQENFCASRHGSFLVTLASPTKHSLQQSCTHCRALSQTHLAIGRAFFRPTATMIAKPVA